jgi:hypothetical protein
MPVARPTGRLSRFDVGLVAGALAGLVVYRNRGWID